MSLEIERKFLCKLTRKEAKKIALEHFNIESVYLKNTKKHSIRLQLKTGSNKSICTCTEKKSTDNFLVRKEKEKKIPEEVFYALDKSKYPSLSKERFIIDYEDSLWEVDFYDSYAFVIAELEFNSVEEANKFKELPPWVTTEVTDAPFFLNCNLAFLKN